MIQNNPIFSDLSSYDPEKSIEFYNNVFGWEYYKEYDYYTAYVGDKIVAGLYETPEKFKQMRMPHFWMTYIQVNNVAETVEKASLLGGIIEMSDEILGFGKVALIRDPLGAGFTIYEGDNLKNSRIDSVPNALIWNELHVSDINKIWPFYKSIFHWELEESSDGLFHIYNLQKEHIADIVELSNRIKGKYEYWVSSFGVSDLQETKKKILSNNGSIIMKEGERILFTDNSGEAFFYATEV